MALNHQTPDRVPVDFGGSRVTGIGALAYNKLLRRLGIQEAVHLYDIKQQLADPSLAVIDRMGGDVVQLHRLGPTTAMPFLMIDRWKPGFLTDGSPCLVPEAYEEFRHPDGLIEIVHEGQVFARRTPESLYFDVCCAPLADAETPADIDAFEWLDPWTTREEEYLKRHIQDLYYGTDKALFGGLPMLVCSLFEISQVLFGFENFMTRLMTDRDLIEYWLEAKLRHDFEILEKFLAVAGPYLEAIQMNDDFGNQRALQISPKVYREVFKPRQKRWIDFVKARTSAKVFIHCDGAIEPLLPDFIEIGIDILNLQQTSAQALDAQRIKREFGRDLALWGGGVETQTTLAFGSIGDVERQVRERVRILREDGGFVFATMHNIQPDISPEKVLTVYDTVAACTNFT